MPCYVVCKKCGHRGSLFTKDLDPYQVQAVEENIKAQNLRNLANSEEGENEVINKRVWRAMDIKTYIMGLK